MGCGAAKATAATSPSDDAPEVQQAETVTEKATGNIMESKPTDNGKPVSKPVAFDIPLDEEQSIIKKHPPKRLQLLEEQAQNLTICPKVIEEKQSKAEERRQEILQERVNNAQKFQQRMAGMGPKSDDETTLPNGVDDQNEEA